MKSIEKYLTERLNLKVKELEPMVRSAMTTGQITYDGELYGVSRENINWIFEEIAPADELDRILTMLEKKERLKFKYETDKEFEKDGLKNPIK